MLSAGRPRPVLTTVGRTMYLLKTLAHGISKYRCQLNDSFRTMNTLTGHNPELRNKSVSPHGLHFLLLSKLKQILTLSETFSRKGSKSCSGTWRKRLVGLSSGPVLISAAVKVRISMAVRRVCFLDGTNMMTGFLGECLKMHWYAGFAMAMIRDVLWEMLKPWNVILKYVEFCFKIFKNRLRN